MIGWNNKIDRDGWYWVWHDYDHSYENRKPTLKKLYFLVDCEFAVEGTKEIIRKHITRKLCEENSIPFRPTTWFYGPVELNPPKPPIPSNEYLKELQCDLNHAQNFFASISDDANSFFKEQKEESKSKIAELSSKIQKIISLRNR